MDEKKKNRKLEYMQFLLYLCCLTPDENEDDIDVTINNTCAQVLPLLL